MNLEVIETICKKETKDAYYWFQHALKYNLFPVNRSYIDQNIYHMKVAIGQKVMKKLFKLYSPSMAQIEVICGYIEKYKSIAIRYALKYGDKFLIKAK